MNARFRRSISFAPPLCALLVGAAVCAFGWTVESRLNSRIPQAAEISIPPGATLSQIARAVAEQAKLPLAPRRFVALAKLPPANGLLRAGKYRFNQGDSARKIILAMARGDNVVPEKFTIVEGKNFREILAALRDDSRFADSLSAMDESAILEKLGAAENKMEGLLLPETYFFNAGADNFSILRESHARLRETLRAAWRDRAPNLPLATPYEALTLASIVEKETGLADERPRIAAVFVNRLRRRMRLQTDPSVIYGLGEKFDGNLTRAHLKADTPYNTYTRAGLPPAPIAMPGADAIRAALNPPESDEYYFVATGDGGHYFSKTLREHNNAVNKYQRRRRKK